MLNRRADPRKTKPRLRLRRPGSAPPPDGVRKRRHGLRLVLMLAGAGIWPASMAAAAADVDAAAAARAIEGRLRERAAALAARASTLSELPRLAAAVATDAATMRDLTGEELAFRPRPGEIITVAQLFRDGRRLPLLTLPERAALDAPSAPGLKVGVAGGALALIQTVKIVPAARADELVGLLSVLWPVSAAELEAGVGTPSGGSALEGVLEIDGQRLTLGGQGAAGGGDWVSAPIHLPADAPATATLSLRVPASGRAGALWAAAGGGVLLLGALLASLRRMRRRGSAAGAGATGSSAPALPSTSSLPSSPSRSAIDVPTAGPSANSVTPTAPPGLPRTAVLPGGARSSVATLPAGGSSDPRLSAAGGAALSSPGAGVAVAAPSAAAAAPTVGDRIGRYVILKPLGQGGMAEVFLARAEGEAGFEKLVAVKVLQPAFAANPGVVDLFLDEARVAAGLNHPNIVQTHDLGRVGDRYFIAMEFVDGPDLARLLAVVREQGESVPVAIALGILCRICDGLHAAHTAAGPDGKPLSLVHRDVKSANVFVSRAGVVKIGDFGIAKATHAVRVSRTEIGLVKGTPGTMAPEQRLGQDVDTRADVYGVGAIAYEILSGLPVNLDFVALAARGTAGWPHLAPLGRSRADVPPALDDLIVKALSYERADRPLDCVDLERALRAIGAASAVTPADDKTIGAWTRAKLERGGAAVAATVVATRDR